MDGEVEAMDRRQWTFDRKITMGEVIGVVSIIGAMYIGGTNVVTELRQGTVAMDKRVTVLEEKAAMQQRIDQAQDANMRDAQQRIEASLAEIQRFLRDQRKP